jgi:ATP-dependent helicase/nuclease subunit B
MRGGAHPRVFIYGALESRLLHVDRAILAGLNEGVWPRHYESGPWLPIHLRKKIGMMDPKWRAGMSAHDFVQASCNAKEVFLLSSRERGGRPAIESRWLTQINLSAQLLGVSKNETGAQSNTKSEKLEKLAHYLTGADRPRKSVMRPEPSPEAGLRPRELSVSDVETWFRNPYALYARKILRLNELPPLRHIHTPRHYGTIIHDIIGKGIIHCQKEGIWDDREKRKAVFLSYASRFLKENRAMFLGEDLSFHAIPKMLDDFLSFYDALGSGRPIAEKEGRITIGGAHEGIALKGITLKGRADLIHYGHGGLNPGEEKISVIDYKTGTLPAPKEYKTSLLLPQLPLLAHIVSQGGFGVPASLPENLSYWKLNAKTGESKEQSCAADFIDLYLEKLNTLLKGGDKTPYSAAARNEGGAPKDIYAHLAREDEWRKT